MTLPLVSVLIPVYNREKVLRQTIESALAQTYTPIEIVVVDNRSTDASWSIIEEFAMADSRVRAFLNDANVGPVGNWSRCFQLARGEFGKILFSDDLLRPDAIQRYMAGMREDTGFVFSSVEIGESLASAVINYNWRPRSGQYTSAEFIRDALLGNDTPLSPCAALFRTADLRKNLHACLPGTRLDFSAHGAGPDVLLYLLTAANYSSVAFVAEPLVFFRAHPGSLSVSAATSKKVTQAYCQTKVWFANSHRNSIDLDQVVVKAWLSFRAVDESNATLADFYRDIDTKYRGKISVVYLLRCYYFMRSKLSALRLLIGKPSRK